MTRQSFGIAIGGTIVQNVLLRDLPSSFVAALPQGVEIAYAIIPTVRGLQEPDKEAVRRAFANAIRVVWRVMLGISVAGFLASLVMREEELRTDMDEKWALQERKKDGEGSVESEKSRDVESGST